MKQSPLNRMSARRRAELAAAGNTNPYNTFTNTGAGLSCTAADRDVKPAPVQRRRDTGPSAETVALVIARDQFRCVRCGGALTGTRGLDWSCQHRRARGSGGTRREDTNQAHALILLDGSGTTGCHGHVETHRTEAREFGWAIRQTDDPAHMPVLHAVHGWVLLDADGGHTTYSTNRDHQEATA